MSKRGVTFLLGLTLVIALGTLIQDFRFDGLIARERATGLAVDRDFGTLAQSLGDLRSAQAGYVGIGQAPGAWMTRAAELFASIERWIHARKAAAPSADAVARYDAALQALASLKAIDDRARTAVEQDDRLQASDLIYIDSTEARDKLGAGLAAARAIEEQATSQRMSRFATLRLAMNSLAVVLIAVVALYFGRAVSILGRKPPASTFQMLRELPPPVVKPGTVVAPPAAHTPPVAAAAPRSAALSTAAELCVDLARVLDGRDVPALLERTATLLDAKGVVLWAVDTSGAMLRPSLCHGYSEKVMSRLRPLQVDGDNVTSLAFRSMQPQMLPGAALADPGAMAVPLLTATGCVGVLAAETRQSRPHPDLLPLARIVAAQFSTLVAPADDAVSRTAQA